MTTKKTPSKKSTTKPAPKKLAERFPINKGAKLARDMVTTAEDSRAMPKAKGTETNLPNTGALYKVLQRPAITADVIAAYCAQYSVQATTKKGTKRTRREIARDLAKAMVAKREVPQAVIAALGAKKKGSSKSGDAKRASWPEHGAKASIHQLSAWVEANAAKVWTGKAASCTPRDLRHLVANVKSGRIELPAHLSSLSEEKLEALRAAKLRGRGDASLAEACVRGIVASLTRAYVAYTAAHPEKATAAA